MKTRTFLIPIILLAFLLVACGAGSANPTDEAAAVDAVYTAAVMTLSAQAAAATSTPTSRPSASPTAQASPTNTAAAAPQYVAAPAAAVSSSSTCDNASFVSDVTIPDGTILAPGESFTKTWLFQNTGSCAWLTSYSISFVSGNAMSGSTTALASAVSSGGQTNVSVSMVAPSTTSTYTGYWKLKNAAGTTFGQSVYVQIVVSDDAATVTPTPTSTSESSYTSTPTSTTAATSAPTSTTQPTSTSQPTSTTQPTATTAPTAVPTIAPSSTPEPTNTPIPADTTTSTEAPLS